MHVVCLSYGERDESTKLWRKGNMTEEMVKQHRRIEAQAAADILDVSIEFFHLGDYPLRAEQDTLFRLADVFRSVQPHFVLTHSIADPSNYVTRWQQTLLRKLVLLLRQKVSPK